MFKERQHSKIFVRNVSVLDCAIWDLYSGPLGRSWNVDVEWQGATDSEGVVIDFSAAKKLAKDVIDSNFDHRLLVPKNHTQSIDGGFVVCFPPLTTHQSERFLLHTYESSLAVLRKEIFEEIAQNRLSLLEVEIADSILKKSPKNVEKVKVSLSPHTQSGESHFFNYLHSLRLHQGNCQRFHGHSNTIEVFSKGSFNKDFSSTIAKRLDGKYLVADCYLREPCTETLNALMPFLIDFELGENAYTWVSYQGSQGVVSLRVPTHRLLIMPKESTIENIAEWVHSTCLDSDCSIEVRAFEGLHKGAIAP